MSITTPTRGVATLHGRTMKNARACCAALLILAAVTHAFADATIPAEVRAKQSGEIFSLDNGLISVEINAATSTLTASSAGKAFIRDAHIIEGAATGEIASSLGNGRAIVL